MGNRRIGRRTARRRAFQFVYAMNFRVFADESAVRQAFFDLPEDRDFDEELEEGGRDRVARTAEDREFAARLAVGVHGSQHEIDRILQRFSRHWRIERIAKVELSILRLAVSEMLHEPDIPLRVSINEAVELSKQFGDQQSFPFVNGVLDAVARAVHNGEFGVHKEF